jgi:uncharacterized protein (TIGR02145 family)
MRIKSNKNLAISVLAILLLFCNCSINTTGKIIDNRDNQSYKTVIIGEQCWMAENLKFLPYISPPDSDSGIYVYGYYGKNVNEAKQTINYQIYGVLYNWATAMGLPNKYNSETWNVLDSLHKGICPEGWHLPSDMEWNKLEQFLEIKSDFNKNDKNRKTGNVGLKIKSDTFWNENGNGTNVTGFSALPSGFRYRNGIFDKIGRYGYFWTSTQLQDYGNHSACYRYLIYSSDGTYRSYPSKKNGLPVRCVKN